ncbi:phospholipase a2 [Myxozyma melibiosi]|uniref:Lysophospholipase n=1 Tax=Myxozyma melibiosi TaxID=54550 RepID=A0ABR1F5R8_9ASCO
MIRVPKTTLRDYRRTLRYRTLAANRYPAYLNLSTSAVRSAEADKKEKGQKRKLKFSIYKAAAAVVASASAIASSSPKIKNDEPDRSSILPKAAPTATPITVTLNDSSKGDVKAEGEDDGATPISEKLTHFIDESYSGIQAKMADMSAPAAWDDIVDWTTSAIGLPGWINKIQSAFDTDKPDSLGHEIIEDSQDEHLNPEVGWGPAHVRLGNQLNEDERKFLHQRKTFTRRALAKYLGIPESSINDADIPTIAVTGSGGGYRAMIGTAGYLRSLQKSGLLDCVTYLGGVSGSTWLMALMYTLADFSTVSLLEHIKSRVGVHIAFLPSVLDLCTKAPTDKYLLHGLIEKVHYNYSDVRLSDVYGILLASRLMVPKDEMIVDRNHLKISNQRTLVDTGAVPLPIYTAVRHEIGLTEGEQSAVDDSSEASGQTKKLEVENDSKRESWFQWFEITPYEVGSEEIGAWIPTWSMSRRWQNGSSVGAPTPEPNLSLLMGTFGSAFCATLSHFYKEVRPALGDFGVTKTLDKLVNENDEDLKGVHPIQPAGIPNFLLGLKPYLPSTCPESLFISKEIELMDAGMDNNLAIYPLLRPEREVDMILAFDCSANLSQVKWLELTAGYTKKRGILGWPADAGWPLGKNLDEDLKELEKQDEIKTTKDAIDKFASGRDAEKEAEAKPKKRGLFDRKGKKSKDAEKSKTKKEAETLGPVTIWTGVTSEKEQENTPEDHPETIDEEYKLRSPDAGITLVYCPLLPNKKVAGVDPDESPYMSTWNFIYSPTEVDKVVDLAQTNFAEGEERVKRAVRLIYERKKQLRLKRESEVRDLWKGKILHGDK